MSALMTRRFTLLGLLVAIAVAVLLSPLASRSPDGLERVAEDKGFRERGEAAAVLRAPAPDYTIPGVESDRLSTPLAGALGTLGAFGCALVLAQVLSLRRKRRADS